MIDDKLCPILEPFGCAVSLPSDTGRWVEGDDTIWLLLFTRLLNDLLLRGVENGITLTFDDKPEVKNVVNKHYAAAKKIVDARTPGKLRGSIVAFGSDEDFPPLQAADLFAYEWRKRLSDKYLTPLKSPRPPYTRIKAGRPNRTLRYYNHDAMRALIATHNDGNSFVKTMCVFRPS